MVVRQDRVQSGPGDLHTERALAKQCGRDLLHPNRRPAPGRDCGHRGVLLPQQNPTAKVARIQWIRWRSARNAGLLNISKGFPFRCDYALAGQVGDAGEQRV